MTVKLAKHYCICAEEQGCIWLKKVEMGGCKESPDTCNITSRRGYEVDIMHFSIGNSIPELVWLICIPGIHTAETLIMMAPQVHSGTAVLRPIQVRHYTVSCDWVPMDITLGFSTRAKVASGVALHFSYPL
ncbi:hypothetical protein ACJIZ3_014550 [Penstemon smallii]|uniref:Uncharacterized protein n=1 Tax=Penstemon smallii TaxID=265156 RepID=A0ABD3RJW8_9LAMI